MQVDEVPTEAANKQMLNAAWEVVKFCEKQYSDKVLKTYSEVAKCEADRMIAIALNGHFDTMPSVYLYLDKKTQGYAKVDHGLETAKDADSEAAKLFMDSLQIFRSTNQNRN